MKKIKIAWLTGHSFIDVDKPLIPLLANFFDIQWTVIRNQSCWYSEKDIQTIIDQNKINGHIYTMSGRMSALSTARMYRKILKQMQDYNANLYYINYIGIPYLWPLLFMSGISNKQIIYPCHDFHDHKGVPNRLYYLITKKLIFNFISNIQFFSQTQQKLFCSIYKNKNIFNAPLALKNFGKATEMKRTDKIVFLFFGSIRENKGLEVLIKAANEVYERHPQKFIVKICGNTDRWNFYNVMIKHPECFSLDIRRIENHEIPNVFADADYLVLPYRDVTQSGPLLISYNYQLPVIASAHDGFAEYIEHGKTGFLFKNEDEHNLADIMCDIIEGKFSYHDIKTNLAMFIQNNCSLKSIVSKYMNGFMTVNDIVNNHKK